MMAPAFLLLIVAGETLAQLREDSTLKTASVKSPDSGEQEPLGEASKDAIAQPEVSVPEGAGGLSAESPPSKGNSTVGDNGEWNGLVTKDMKNAVLGPGQDRDKAPDDAAKDILEALKLVDRKGNDALTSYYIDSSDPDNPQAGTTKHQLKKVEVVAAFSWLEQELAMKRGMLEAKLASLDKKPLQLAELAQSLSAAQRDTQEKIDNILDTVHESSLSLADKVDTYTSFVAKKTDPDSGASETWNTTADAVLLERLGKQTRDFQKSSTKALGQMKGYLAKWVAVAQKLHQKQGEKLSDWSEAIQQEMRDWRFHETKRLSDQLDNIKDKQSVEFTAILQKAEEQERLFSTLAAKQNAEVLEEVKALDTNSKVLSNEAKRVKTQLDRLDARIKKHDMKFNKKVTEMKEAFEGKAEQTQDEAVSTVELFNVKETGKFQELMRKAETEMNAAVVDFEKTCDHSFKQLKESMSEHFEPIKIQDELNEKYAKLNSDYSNMLSKITVADVTGKNGRLTADLHDAQKSLAQKLASARVDLPDEEKRYGERVDMLRDFLNAHVKSFELDAKLSMLNKMNNIDSDIHRLADQVGTSAPNTGAGLSNLIQVGEKAVQDAEAVRFQDAIAPIMLEQRRLLETKDKVGRLVDQAARQQQDLLNDAAKQLSERSGHVPGSLAQLAGARLGPDALVKAEEQVKQRLPKDLQDWSAQMSMRLEHLVDALHEVGPDLKSLATLRGNGVTALQPLLPKAEPSTRIANVFDKLEAAAKVTASMPEITDQANKEWASGLKRRMEAALAASGQSVEQFVERGLGAPDMHTQVQEASSWLEASRTTQKATELQGDLGKHISDTIAPVNAAAQRLAVSSLGRLETEQKLFAHTQQALDLLDSSNRQMRQQQNQVHSDIAVAVGQMAEKVERQLSKTKESDLSVVKKPLQQEMDELGQMNSYLGLALPEEPQQQISAVSKQLEELKSSFDQAKGEAQVLAQQREQLLEQHKAAPRYVDARVMDEYGRPQIKVPGRKPLITESLSAVDDAIGLLRERLQTLPDKLDKLMPTREEIDAMLPHVDWPDVGVAMDALDDINALRPGDALVNAAALDERRVDDFEVKMAKLVGPRSDADQALKNEQGEILGADSNAEIAEVKQKALANNAALEHEADQVQKASFEKLNALAAGATKLTQAALPQWRSRAKAFDAKISDLQQKEAVMATWQKNQESANSKLEAEDEAWHEKIAKVLDRREAPKTQTLLEQLQRRSQSRAAQDEKREEHVKALESKMRALHT